MPRFCYFCPKCYEEILDLDEISASFWSIICIETEVGNPFHLIEPVFNRIRGELPRRILDEKMRFLEKNGFILTHEVDKGVVILKLLGVSPIESEVCVGRHLT